MGILRFVSKLLLVKSFVLGGILLCIWVRSYWVADTLAIHFGDKSASFTSACGLVIYRAVADGSQGFDWSQRSRSFTQSGPSEQIKMLDSIQQVKDRWGFSYHPRRLGGDRPGLCVTVTCPYWFFFLLGSSKAIIWSIRRYLRTAVRPTQIEGRFGWCARCQTEQRVAGSVCSMCGGPIAWTSQEGT